MSWYSIGHVGGKKDQTLRARSRHSLEQTTGASYIDVREPFVSVSMWHTSVKLPSCEMVDDIIAPEINLLKVPLVLHIPTNELDGSIHRVRLCQIEYDRLFPSSH